MKRYDLRHLSNDFENRLNELCDSLESGEVGIFLFEVRDFANVQKLLIVSLIVVMSCSIAYVLTRWIGVS